MNEHRILQDLTRQAEQHQTLAEEYARRAERHATLARSLKHAAVEAKKLSAD